MTLSLLDLIFILLLFGALFERVLLVIKSECERRGSHIKAMKEVKRNEKA